MATLVQVIGVLAWVVVVVCAAPHHSPARHLRATDGTLAGGEGLQALTRISSRGRRRAGGNEEDCDEWERSLTPPRKRLAKQQAAIDKPYKREALEVNIGTGILVQGATTTKPPYASPQNPSYVPTQPPYAFPQNPPSPTQPPDATFRPLSFPQNPPYSPTQPPYAFPQNPPSPTKPPDATFRPLSFPQNPPFSPTQPPYAFPQNPPYAPTQPPDTTFRPISFPDAGPQTTAAPPSNQPTQVPPTIFHDPFFPNDLFPSPGPRPNPSDGSYPRPPAQNPRLPAQNPASQRPTLPPGYFPVQSTPDYLFFPNGPTQRPNIPNTPQRPSFPISPNQGPGYIQPTTRRPKFPGFPTTRKPCSCRNRTRITPSTSFSPSPVAPPVYTVSPQFPTPTPGVQRPVTPNHSGFRPNFRPNFTPVPAFPVFPNPQPRPVFFVPYYGPLKVSRVNQRPPPTNVRPRFPVRQPINRQRIPAPPRFRVYVTHPKNQSSSGGNKVDKTEE